MHKHSMKFVKASPHFLFWKCRTCGSEFIEARSKFLNRFLGNAQKDDVQKIYKSIIGAKPSWYRNLVHAGN